MKLIAIHSMPRSGSTWLGSIIDSIPNVSYKMQPLFSYKLKGFLSDQSDREDIELFKKRLLELDDEFMDQIEKKRRNSIPNFKKDNISMVAYKETRFHYILDNLLHKDENTFIVGLIRNPLAHLNSWFNAPKEFRLDLDWKIEEEWLYANKKNEGKREEYYGYEKWKEVAYLFHELKEKFPSRVYLIDYVELLRDPGRLTERLFYFLDIQMQQQTINFIHDSRNKNINDPYGVYRTKINDNSWKESLPEYIINYVKNDLEGTKLEEYLK